MCWEGLVVSSLSELPGETGYSGGGSRVMGGDAGAERKRRGNDNDQGENWRVSL